MATYVTLEKFIPAVEEFSSFIERVHYFFDAHKITDDAENAKQRKGIMLCALGPATLDLLHDLMYPERPADKTFDEIVAVLKSHFEPPPNATLGGYKFLQCKQKKNQSIAEFVAELRKTAKHLDYPANFLERVIRDQLYSGVRNNEIREKIIEESLQAPKQSLTLQQTIAIARNIEAVEQAMKRQHLSEQGYNPDV